MTESTVYDVWIIMTMRTTVELDGVGVKAQAIEEAERLMPSHAIDALERHGYRITTIETEAKPRKRPDFD